MYNPGKNSKATTRELARRVDHFSGLQSGGWEFQRGLPSNIDDFELPGSDDIEEIRAEFVRRGTNSIFKLVNSFIRCFLKW